MAQKRGRGVQRERKGYTSAETAARNVRAKELVRQGVDCLGQARVAAAQRYFRQALGMCKDMGDARAYLALTHVLQRNWDQAIVEAILVLDEQPDHLLALTALARARAGSGQFVEASSCSARVLRTFYGNDDGHTRSVAQLGYVIEMLVDLEQDRRLHQLYRRCLRGRPYSLDETTLAYLGVAAYNSGHHRDARWIWRTAQLAAAERAELFASYLLANQLVEDERIPHFRLDYALGPETEASYHAEPQGFLKVFALRTLWTGDDVDAQRSALELLSFGDEDWETAFLTSVLQDHELSDEVKMHAGAMLIERGLIPEDEPLEMFIDGELRPVIIRTEQTEPHLDEETAAVFGEALAADAQGMGATAEAGYRAVLELVPTFVPALLGLATICRYSDRLDEAEELLLKALEVEPLDPLVLFNVATLRIQQEQYRGAWSVLRAVNVAELPPDLRPLYYWTFGRLALQFDMPDAAETAFRHGLQLNPDSEELIDGLTAALEVADNARRQALAQTERRRMRHENRPIGREVTWPKALERLTLPRLQAIGRHVGVTGVWKMRKADLVMAVTEVLRDHLGVVWHSLSVREQEALRWIDRRGGVVSYDELRRRFGTDQTDSVDWLELEPETVPMRLQFSGLLFVGRLEEQAEPVAIVPRETRQALRFAWRQS